MGQSPPCAADRPLRLGGLSLLLPGMKPGKSESRTGRDGKGTLPKAKLENIASRAGPSQKKPAGNTRETGHLPAGPSESFPALWENHFALGL